MEQHKCTHGKEAAIVQGWGEETHIDNQKFSCTLSKPQICDL